MEKRRRGKEGNEKKKKKKEEIFHLHADVFQRLRCQTVSISNPPTFHLFLTFEIRGFIVSNFFFANKIGQIRSSSNIK